MPNFCLHGTLFHNSILLSWKLHNGYLFSKVEAIKDNLVKVAQSQTDFHFGSNLQIAVANNDPEHYPPK